MSNKLEDTPFPTIAPGTLLSANGTVRTVIRTEPRSGAVIAELPPAATVIYLGEHKFVEFQKSTIGPVDGILWLKVLTSNGIGWCRAHRLDEVN